MELAESFLIVAVRWLVLILEVIGATLVGLGGITAFIRLARTLQPGRDVRFTPVRLHFARYLSLALEFQLGADILGTAIAPTWEQIGRLGAIAVIRTGLNYFLGLEMKEERETIEGEARVERDAAESSAARPAPRSL